MKPEFLESGNWAWYIGDSRQRLKELPEKIIHTAITSPPYYNLRDYKIDGQIGLEETPELFQDSLAAVFAEVRRVLRDDGVLWVNLGDTFDSQGNLYQVPALFAAMMKKAGWFLRSEIIWRKTSPMPESLGGWRWERHKVKVKKSAKKRMGNKVDTGIRTWTTIGADNMAAAADWADCPGCDKCNKTGGLILRKGSWRPTRSHEFIYMFSKTDSYYADPEPVRTRLAAATLGRDQYSRILEDPEEQFAVKHDHETPSNPAGANRRDVWPMDETILSFLQKALDSGNPELIAAAEVFLAAEPTDVWDISAEPLKLGHYAAFPPELPRLCIAASCSEKGVCPVCGEQWARVLEVSGGTIGQSWHNHKDDLGQGQRGGDEKNLAADGYKTYKRESKGWKPTCNCGREDTLPPLVLDPFAGAGTTILTARRMGCRAIGIELSPAYSQMAVNRIKQDNPLFN